MSKSTDRIVDSVDTDQTGPDYIFFLFYFFWTGFSKKNLPFKIVLSGQAGIRRRKSSQVNLVVNLFSVLTLLPLFFSGLLSYLEEEDQ